MPVLYLGLLWASIADCINRRIPNRIAIFLMLWGIARCMGREGYWGFLTYGGTGLAVFLVFYPFYKIGALGAGDVKLLSVAAGYFPGDQVLGFLGYSFFVAAAAALVRITREGNGRERLEYLADYLLSIVKTGNIGLYEQELRGKKTITICLAGPLLLGALLQGGGIT